MLVTWLSCNSYYNKNVTECVYLNDKLPSRSVVCSVGTVESVKVDVVDKDLLTVATCHRLQFIY